MKPHSADLERLPVADWNVVLGGKDVVRHGLNELGRTVVAIYCGGCGMGSTGDTIEDAMILHRSHETSDGARWLPSRHAQGKAVIVCDLCGGDRFVGDTMEEAQGKFDAHVCAGGAPVLTLQDDDETPLAESADLPILPKKRRNKKR